MSDQPLAERVQVLLTRCQTGVSELPEGRCIKVEAFSKDYVFDRDRVDAHRVDIAAICNELPTEFQLSIGGGASLLELSVDRQGVRWAEPLDCEAILALAIASDLGAFSLPRDSWPAMPGGIPFVYFKTEGLATETPSVSDKKIDPGLEPGVFVGGSWWKYEDYLVEAYSRPIHHDAPPSLAGDL